MTRGKTLTVQLKMYPLRYFVKAYISEGSTVLHFLEGVRVFSLELSGDNSFSKTFYKRKFTAFLKYDLGKRLNPYGIIVGNVDVEKPSLTD
ncbi:unnamed protein product [Brassica rapa subsp. trilocularis]